MMKGPFFRLFVILVLTCSAAGARERNVHIGRGTCPMFFDSCQYNAKVHIVHGFGPRGLPYIILRTDPKVKFGTPDGGGNIVGEISHVELKLAREYDKGGGQFTHMYLSFFYYNGARGYTESDKGGGWQAMDLNLLDSAGNLAVADIASTQLIPRYRCWYSGVQRGPGDETLPYQQYRSDFDFVGKDIKGISLNIHGFWDYQGPC